VESEISIGAMPPLLRYPILMALVYMLNRTAKSQVRQASASRITNDKCMNATRYLPLAVVVVLFEFAAVCQTSQSLSVPSDSPRWELQQGAKVAEYLGRKCLAIDGGAAVLKDFEMRDGVLDVDVATAAKRGFFGFDVRIDKDGANYEEIYLRQHKSGLPDAMQYTPVLNTPAGTGNCSTDLVLPAPSIFLEMNGSISALRSRAYKQSSTSKIWISRHWS
jgi:hypothetical protein